jgi:hypothetical protein
MNTLDLKYKRAYTSTIILVAFCSIISLLGCSNNQSIDNKVAPEEENLSAESYNTNKANYSEVASAQVKITGISGHNDKVGVRNGKWTGQPSRAPRTASNAYLDHYVIDSQNNSYFWTIQGENFGNSVGSVQLFDRNFNVLRDFTIEISPSNWKSNSIRITVKHKDKQNFQFFRNAYIRVSRLKNPPPTSNTDSYIWETPINIVGIIQSRGFGQCTWFVANTRLNQSLRIPPSAYTTTGQINDANYVPALWDCLTYGSSHVAIITSVPTSVTNSDRSTSWKFTVSEMNAKWNESSSTFNAEFRVNVGRGNQRSVIN